MQAKAAIFRHDLAGTDCCNLKKRTAGFVEFMTSPQRRFLFDFKPNALANIGEFEKIAHYRRRFYVAVSRYLLP